jgi:dipeptidyl aminopeptidase/acylaminoacyl peptidase
VSFRGQDGNSVDRLTDHDSQVSTYSFEHHRKTSQVRLLDIETQHTELLYEDATYSEPTWIEEDRILLLKNSEKGSWTKLLLADVSKPGAEPKEIACFAGALSGLKLCRLSKHKVAFAITALATPKGKLYNPDLDKDSRSTGKVFSSLFVRHWDSYVTENTKAIWYGCLETHKHGYNLSTPDLVNALAGTKLQSPVPPFGGAGDFDIGPKGIAFVSRDPDLIPALYTKSDVYFVPLSTFTEQRPKPQLIKTGRLQGYAGSPTFSPDGRALAFTKMRSRQYESDKTRLMIVPDISDLSAVQEFYETEDGEGGWDARPESIVWSEDGTELYVTAEQCGRGMLWKLPSAPEKATDMPDCLLSDGTVTEVHRMCPDAPRLLISGSTLVDNSWYASLEPSRKGFRILSSNSKQGKSFGLSKSQCDEIWFKGAGDYQVHALVMKPSHFDDSKKYPLAFLIHGGPQGAWLDSWSTRWNPAVFAEQGYVVVCPNPTGSTGYGMSLQNGIRNDWGGRPYDDLVNCFEHIETKMPYVDVEKAVALGASYGGYMISTSIKSPSYLSCIFRPEPQH